MNHYTSTSTPPHKIKMVLLCHEKMYMQVVSNRLLLFDKRERKIAWFRGYKMGLRVFPLLFKNTVVILCNIFYVPVMRLFYTSSKQNQKFTTWPIPTHGTYPFYLCHLKDEKSCDITIIRCFLIKHDSIDKFHYNLSMKL